LRGPKTQTKWRLYLLWGVLSVAVGGIVWRLVDLNVVDRAFLLKQSQARILRTLHIPAYRGMITDRLGTPLAISTPVESVWVNPKLFHASQQQLNQLAQLLHLPAHYILRRTKKVPGREFVYLKRRNSPQVAKQIKALDIDGVYFQREYKRFYPEGEVAAHVVGLTNVDDAGQEGLELAYNHWLAGQPGKKEVLKDRLGHIISTLAITKVPQQGRNLTLSIDHRIQYLAYSTLKHVVDKYHAQAGSVVVLNAKTGEILAMVNQPSYNPNNRPKDHDGRYRNRAVTDTFEPGSTMKPFNIAFALQSGEYKPSSTINTNPGRMKVGGYTIKDDGLNYGVINLTQVLQKSSNIGAAKILMSLQPQLYWRLLRQMGFGEPTRSGFPGEENGSLLPRRVWYPSVVATLAYGYGVSVTTLQLAHAYSILADHGLNRPVSFLKLDNVPAGVEVLNPDVAKEVLTMLETVVKKGGTGTRAQVPGYRVAGKTGTAYIAGPNGYNKHRYISSFVGIAPVSHPELVVAVVIRDPKGQHFGGIVAAPAFSKIMGGALRILDIMPDNLHASSHGVIPMV